MELLPAVVCALIGAVAGLVAPRLIALCPEPEVNPAENPEDWPDHVPFAELAARPGLALRCAAAGLVAGGVLGGLLGWNWSLLWLLALVPVLIALTVIDYVTWYLPSRLILPSYLVVLVLEVVGAVALEEPRVLLLAAIGFVALGGYYGLMWFISPRIMAFGDVRLGALLGLALGPFGLGYLLLSVLAAAVLAVLGLIPLRRGGVMVRRRVPYGPFLVLGAFAALALGRVIALS